MIPHPLKVAREQHGWSQAKLAELLGVSTRTVSRWEKYETLPYPFYRERLCSLFDKNASELGLLELNHPPPIAVSPTASNHDDYNDQQTDITSGKIENQSEKPFFSETRRRRRFKQLLLAIALLVLVIIVSGLGIFLFGLVGNASKTQIRTISINAGGGQAGSFVADTGYTSDTHRCQSSTHSIDISGVYNPAPQTIYQSNHCGPQFTYTLSHLVPSATYTVRLHFAETYWTQPGKRVFNVSINDQPALTSFDIVAATGGPYRAIVKQFTTTSTSKGTISITFSAIKDNALISGIETSIKA